MLSKLTPQAFAPLEALFKRERFKEEFNIELKLGGSHLCHVKVFTGRPPYYGPWAEVFNLSPSFVGSSWELHVYCVLHRYMEPGDTLYVEYIEDRETFNALRRGIPPEETRLGRLLAQCGFRIVKDWYFPEGWLKGGMKLQTEKCRLGRGRALHSAADTAVEPNIYTSTFIKVPQRRQCICRIKLSR